MDAIGSQYHTGAKTDWSEDLTRSIAMTAEKELRERLANDGVRSLTTILATLDQIDRSLSREDWLQDEVDRSQGRLTMEKLKAPLQIHKTFLKDALAQYGWEGASGHDWSGVRFEPAESFAGVHEFWSKVGVQASFELPPGVEDGSDGWGDLSDGKVVSYSLDDANKITETVVNLLKEYPDTQMHQIGLAYNLDFNEWEANRIANTREEFAKKTRESKGKKWSKVAARKRVVKEMNPPPPKHFKGDGTDNGHYDYGLFKVAWVSGRGKSMAFNHQSRGMSASEFDDGELRKKEFEDTKWRASQGMRVMPVSNVSAGLRGTTIHEFAHLLDFTHDLRTHPKMVELHRIATEAGRVKNELSTYAETNIQEFIAEGFNESHYDDARPLGIEVKNLIDEIIQEKRGAV
jgi:hypothetical protein